MKDIDRAMKYFIGFSVGSAVILPIVCEMYANISTYSLVFVFAWAVFVGVKFSFLTTKSAMLGITAYVCSSGVLSIFGYLIIHPHIKSWLEENSTYFSLSLESMVKYWASALGLLLLAYFIYFVKLGVLKATGRLKENSSSAASAIDNAFSDDES
ncbi:MAG: hypothetical protein LUE12_02350 [Ruminococcus sp.]|nr:hypothetical protein [Ruminococcus sp.]